MQSSTFPKPVRIGVSQGDSLQIVEFPNFLKIVGDQNNVLSKAVLLFKVEFDT